MDIRDYAALSKGGADWTEAFSAAIAAIRRELGAKWAAAVVIWQCVIAWAAAWLVHLIGTAM